MRDDRSDGANGNAPGPASNASRSGRRRSRSRHRTAPRRDRDDGFELQRPFEVIDTPNGLESFAARIADCEALAIDTEFLPEVGYVPQLCLVQIATEHEDDPIALIDTIAMPDLGPLGDAFADPNVRLVMHNGETDLKLLYHASGQPCRGLFDTQVAAALVGRRESIGLADMLLQLLDVTLPKSQTITNWDIRPLSRSQLVYAAADVAHLLAAANELESRLRTRDRLDWAAEEFHRCEAIALRGTPAGAKLGEVADPRDKDRELRRLPQAWKLDGEQLAVLRELVSWRDARAREIDMQAKRVLGDSQLTRLASLMPRHHGELREMRGFPQRVVDREGEPILAAVQRGLAVPEADRPDPVPPPHLPLEVMVQLEMLQTIVKLTAIEHEIAPVVLATRENLLPLALRAPTDRENFEQRSGIEGWRADILAPMLLDWFTGRMVFGCEQPDERLDANHPLRGVARVALRST